MPRAPNSSPQTRALLSALAAAPDAWRHGFSLAKEVGLRSGTLYPLLIRLADQGLLEAAWEAATTPGIPPRHLYRLTAAGLEFARRPAPDRKEQSVRSSGLATT